MTPPTTVDAASVQRLVDEALRSRLDALVTAAASHGPEFERLCRTTAERAVGGKLLRPRLLLETLFGFVPPPLAPSLLDAAVDVATAVELLHFAFLLHDDVIDGDIVRRGRPNLIGSIVMDSMSADEPLAAEQALHWARTGAILMGDLLLTASVLPLARIDVPAAVRVRLVDLVERVVAETVAGEHADVSFSDGAVRPDLPAILRMTAQKTAAYSFELPMRAAAILAGVTEEAEAAVADAGRRLGLAYQLQDDLLSVFIDAADHGKDPFSDLRGGKETAVIAYARMTSTWARLSDRFGRADLTDQECTAMREALRECGAETFVSALVDENLQAARAVVETSASLPSAVRQSLTALAERVEGRRA